MLLKLLEAVIPESLVMRDPFPHRAEARGDKVIVTLPAMALFGHETCIEQNAEVLRDGRAAHLEVFRNRADGTVSLDEQIQHSATRGMTDCPKDSLLAIGSRYHEVNIRKQWLTSQLQGKWPDVNQNRGQARRERRAPKRIFAKSATAKSQNLLIFFLTSSALAEIL
jgi:hypothetical protein